MAHTAAERERCALAESAFRKKLDSCWGSSYSGPIAPESAFPRKRRRPESPPVEETEMFKHSLKLVAATCALAVTACGSSGSGGPATKDADPASVTGTLR